MKTLDKNERFHISSLPSKGLKAYGKKLTLRDDWEDIKEEVMLYGLRRKFSGSNPSLLKKLIDTGYCDIQEGNFWGDAYWGVDLKTGYGLNRLGKLIMQVREEIRE
ncbi:hypothetical protein PQC39_gp133 [Vibrio phage Vp_R1]|uniref:NADAR domain-containing protein n=1 Tax=Vibrio phage Vp_R1 TaxID=2059867 RepID=A0A2H5BQ89_9CAUD|nr:hypothetical protein PQC39_gp133 [Vibrio phage Vp_R1]AUG88497.1 hypothetical protein VPR_133 [Vibrio phage Vp_R1]